ncbi:MAG: hypothetical protein A2663_01970 [Candidatus Buchananbacteria bacterium RIFCSPHIGHO2_01_FULL_46_12]|uniref:Uncharacterized protein n=1 Tax=Candidatus Buchananbacteria bacterium RIFCSPHIGHO2_01_FULL_46_12 TaxID=1797536 RepID=A0A1G1Y548_9BACT|nr:MAG: hypothetical protein A2663_01970 [Candidatus Buchananbacteria bacterium RIFCSPHIGHO2_01_FULL_46_12]
MVFGKQRKHLKSKIINQEFKILRGKITSTKSQIPNKSQIQNYKLQTSINNVLNFEFEICLEFGAWNL